MKYTFEITVSGCNTKCKHCYINGGPDRNIVFSDYMICIEKLVKVFDYFQGNDISLTLGNEKYNHPQILAIMVNTQELLGQYSSLDIGFDNPTTGIALCNRKDSSDIFSFLHKNHCDTFMLTLHGNETHHNEIVQRDDAFNFLYQFNNLLMENHFTIEYNLMLNKYFVSDWEDIVSFLNSKKDHSCYLTIPLFVPTKRVRQFQKYRANYEECKAIVGKLGYIGLDGKNLESKIEMGNERYVQRLVSGKWDYIRKDKNQPQWAFFHIMQNLDLFYGNAGLHTKYLGNIQDMSIDELIEVISEQQANYDYSAYYDINSLPDIGTISEYAMGTQNNLVYPDAESCIYSWLDSYGVKNILIE